MKKAIVFFGLIVLLGTIAPGDPYKEDGKYSVAAVHAHLYYHATGKINPNDLLDGKPHVLWNAIIGEGEAREPSAAIMVLVDLVGPGFTQCEGRLRLTATDNQKTLLDQTLELSLWLNEGGKVILPFLVCGTGCEEVKITATLEDLPASKVDTETLTKTIPFKCGE
ncbi:MAG: hypothetical protein WCC00_06595 [Candidatus Aminicenantales bacterium]